MICLADTLDSRARVLAAVAAAADGAQDEVALGVAGPDLIRTGPVFGVDNAHELARNACDSVITADSGCANGRDMRNDSREGDNLDQMHLVDVGRSEGGGDYEA